MAGSGLTMRDLKSRAAALSLNKAIRLFNQGDTKAFEFIYRSYCEYVHRICLRMLRDPAEAEDAAQDVFLCVFRKINTFRGESAFSSWLYRLTTNSVLMRFRKKKHTWIPLEESREGEEDSCWETSAQDSNSGGLLDRIDLQSAVEVLPRGYKAAFVLHDIQGYDHREIAEMCGYSIGNSKSQLHKARLRLRKLLGGMPKNGYSKRQDSNQFVSTGIANSPVQELMSAKIAVATNTNVSSLAGLAGALPHKIEKEDHWSPTQQEVDTYTDSLEQELLQSCEDMPDRLGNRYKRAALIKDRPSNSLSLFWGLVAMAAGCFWELARIILKALN